MDHLFELLWRLLSKTCPPILTDSPPRLKEVGREKGESQVSKIGRSQGVKGDGVKEFLVIHPFCPKPFGGTGAVKNLPGKVLKRGADRSTKPARILVPKGVVEVPGCNPPDRFPLRLSPRPGPFSEESRHPGHMGSPLLARDGPDGEGPR